MLAFKPSEEQLARDFDDDPEIDEALQPTLVGVFDEEQKQWTALKYCQHVLKLSFEGFPDPFHVRSNGMWRYLGKSGLTAWPMLAMLFCNRGYGPWGKGAFYTECIEFAEFLVPRLSPNDAVLLKIWPLICSSKGFVTDEETGRSGRERFLETMPAATAWRLKGPKTAPSKFFSIQHAWKFWRQELGTVLLALTELAKEKGWAENWEDIFTSTPLVKIDVPLKASSAAGKSAGKQAMMSIIQKSANALHACARLLADADFVFYNDLIYQFMEPLGDEHSKYAGEHGMRGEASVNKYFARMSAGGWLEPLWAAVQRVGDPLILGKMGLLWSIPRPP